MRHPLLFALFACCAACTIDNPNYVGPGAGDGSDGDHAPPDLAAAHGGADLATSPGAHDGGGSSQPSDLAFAPLCTDGTRRCASSPALTAEVCSGGRWSDRACPAGSLSGNGAACESGHCQPPTTDGTTSCDTGGPLEQICSQNGNGAPQFSCQPFLTGAPGQPGQVEWWCALPIGAGLGGAGAACSTGGDCHSGFCGSNGTCFWACQSDGDCPIWGMHCSAVTLSIEGVSISAPSCS